MRAPSYVTVQLSDVLLDPSNARKHNKANLGAIRRSLARWGQVKPVVFASDGRTVLAGNGTVAAARDLGWTEIRGVVFAGGADEAAAYAIADNRTAELGEWDIGRRERTLDQLSSDPELAWSAWGEQDDEVPRRKTKNAKEAKQDDPLNERAQLVVSCASDDSDAVRSAVAQLLAVKFKGALVQ